MAKQKIDGVIEAVHYSSDGQVAWVRAYERRGAAFSDIVLVSRHDLIEHLRYGKNYFAGNRIAYMAGTFELSFPLRLAQMDGKEFLTLTKDRPGRDDLDNLPVV